MINIFNRIKFCCSLKFLQIYRDKISLTSFFICFILLSAVFLFPPNILADTHYEGDNFSLQIPADWEIFEQDSEGDIEEFIFIVPEESEDFDANDHLYSTNVNIIVERIEAEFTMEEYVDIVLMQLETRLEEFELLQRQDILIAGESGESIEYTGITRSDEELLWQEWITIENNSAYVITYTAREEIYGDYRDEVQQILDSFEF